MAKTLEELQADAKAATNALAAAEKEAAAEAKAKAEPREPEVILADLCSEIVMRLGNRAELRLLITEFKAATKQTPPPAAAPAA